MQEPAAVLSTALAWLEAGWQVALATVVETGGSSAVTWSLRQMARLKDLYPVAVSKVQ